MSKNYMTYTIEVRHAHGMDPFQPYEEEVTAATSHDAVAQVQRRNPGCNVRCCNSYYKKDRDGSSSSWFSSSSSGDSDWESILGSITLLAIIAAIGLVITYWYVILPVAIIAGIVWIWKWLSDS